MAARADGVVVGSALIDVLARSLDDDGRARSIDAACEARRCPPLAWTIAHRALVADDTDLRAAATRLAAAHDPDEALTRWVRRYTEFVATKHGLAAALHSGDPAYSALPGYFAEHLGPALRMLLDHAEAAGVIGPGADPLDLLGAIANLCIPPPGSNDTARAYRMVALLLDGLRYEAVSGRGGAGSGRR